MQKWMGFVLYEHTTSLSEERNRVDLSTDLRKVQKLLLIYQLYVRQRKRRFTVKHNAQKITVIGEVRELSRKKYPSKQVTDID